MILHDYVFEELCVIATPYSSGWYLLHGTPFFFFPFHLFPFPIKFSIILTEYLIPTDTNTVLVSYLILAKKSNLISKRTIQYELLIDISVKAYYFGPPCKYAEGLL